MKLIKDKIIKKLFFNFVDKRYDFIVFCHDTHRADIINKKYYSKIMDSLIEIFNLYKFNSLSIALPYSKRIKEKTWGNAYSINNILRISRLPNRIIRPFKNSKIFFIQKFSNRLIHFFETKLYEKLISFSEAKAVFCIEANIPLCRAARNKKIKIVEVLHGIGYQLIPWNLDKRKEFELPTEIWCLDIKSKNTFLPLKEKGVEIKEIPHPWYSRIPKNNYQNEWTKKIPIVLDTEEFFIPKNYISVLVTLTHGYDNDHSPDHEEYKGILDNGLIPNELIKAIKISNKEIFWCLRRHPKQIQDSRNKHQIKFLEKLSKKYNNIEWKLSSKLPFSTIIKRMKANIQMSSMNCYDCALFGVQSLVMCPTTFKNGIHENLFDELEKLNYVKKEKANAENIIEFIKSSKLMKPIKIVDADIQDFKKDLKIFI